MFQPLDSVDVFLRPGGYSGVSDSVGKYSISGITPGAYSLYFIRDGYSVSVIPQDIPDSAIIIRDVQLKRTTFPQQGTITTNNQPLSNANVYINGEMQTTDNLGRFLFGAVTSGKAAITIVHRMIGKVDTSAVLPIDGCNFNFTSYDLKASIFRLLRPYEKLRPSVPNELAIRTPIATTLMVDDWLGYDSYALNDCNLLLYGTGLAAGRSHHMVIKSTDYKTIDTILTPKSNYQCGYSGSNALSYTLLPEPYVRFNWPLVPSVRIKYEYDSKQKLDHYQYLIRKGYHYWRVVDSTVVSDPSLVAGKKTVFRIENAGFDSLTNLSTYSGTGNTSFVADTSYFTIEVCESEITVNYPYIGKLSEFRTPPGTVGAGTDRELREGIGLYYLSYSAFTMSQGKSEKIRFIQIEN